jgi:hypothetical protein
VLSKALESSSLAAYKAELNREKEYGVRPGPQPGKKEQDDASRCCTEGRPMRVLSMLLLSFNKGNKRSVIAAYSLSLRS